MNRFAIVIVTSVHLDFDKRIWRYARSLVQSGHSVQLVCPWMVPHGTMVDDVRLLTFPRHSNVFERFICVPVRILKQIRRYCRDGQIIHFHDPDLLPWMALLTQWYPIVYDVHENYPEEAERRLMHTRVAKTFVPCVVRSLQRYFASKIGNAVLVADSQIEDLESEGLEFCFVRNYASRTLLEQVLPDYRTRRRIVGFIGRQHENNGTFLLLEIARCCETRDIECTFITPDYFRRPTDRQRFLRMIEEYGLGSRVRFFAPVKAHEIMSVLNRCRVALNPNLRVAQQVKGVHTKMYEFMAAGLPVIASDLPQQKALIDDARCGYALPPEEPDEFAIAIGRLLDNEEQAESFGKNGSLAFRDRYSWEPQLGKLNEFYNQIVRAHFAEKVGT